MLHKLQVTLYTNALITLMFYVNFFFKKKPGLNIIYIPSGICDLKM